MNISLNTVNPFSRYENINNEKKHTQYPKLSTLNQDTVSFGSMKKSQLEDIDLVVVNKYKIPIESKHINSGEDIQQWCYDKLNTDYGIEEEPEDLGENGYTVKAERDVLFDEWMNYCLNENDDYNNAASLLVIDSIAPPKEDLTKYPPVLIKSVSDATIDEIKKNINLNRNYQVNFYNMYQNNLLNHYLKEIADNNYTGWIKIPSQENDSENFIDNVNKLKALSHKSWCTKTYSAASHLAKGDFHIYFDQKKPTIGLRFDEGKIQEIQGESNDGKIPTAYLYIVKDHIKNYKVTDKTASQLLEAENVQRIIKKFENNIGKTISEASAEDLFKAADMFEKRDEDDGGIILKFYSEPDNYISWNDIGVNEDKLLNEVKEIKGDAYFYKSNIKNLDNLERIGGDAYFSRTGIQAPEDLEVNGRIITI